MLNKITKAADANAPKPWYRQSTLYLMIAAVILGALGMFFLPQLFDRLNIAPGQQEPIIRAVVDKWLGLVQVLAGAFGLQRGVVILIKNAAPFLTRYLLERAAIEANKAPESINAAGDVNLNTKPASTPGLTEVESAEDDFSLEVEGEPESIADLLGGVAVDAGKEKLNDFTEDQINNLAARLKGKMQL